MEVSGCLKIINQANYVWVFHCFQDGDLDLQVFDEFLQFKLRSDYALDSHSLMGSRIKAFVDCGERSFADFRAKCIDSGDKCSHDGMKSVAKRDQTTRLGGLLEQSSV